MWRPWWLCWRPLRRHLRVWSVCPGIRPCVCRSWSVWTWWVTRQTRVTSDLWIQRIQCNFVPLCCFVFVDERGSESHEREEVWRGHSAAWKVSCVVGLLMNLWDGSLIVTSWICETVHWLLCHRRSFENNWNTYKLLAHQKPALSKVTNYKTLSFQTPDTFFLLVFKKVNIQNHTIIDAIYFHNKCLWSHCAHYSKEFHLKKIINQNFICLKTNNLIYIYFIYTFLCVYIYMYV